MDKFTRTAEFMAYLFDREEEATKAGKIVEGMLKSQSLRQTEIARGMEGKMETAYKQIQRFVHKCDPREAGRIVSLQKQARNLSWSMPEVAISKSH